MVVGICQLNLYLYGNNSLKGKRQILRQIIDRTKSRFNVSIAEVGDNDLWQSAKIGFSLVGNDSRVINSKLDKIKGFIESINAAEVYGSEWDIVHF
jgi:hypothetical protein